MRQQPARSERSAPIAPDPSPGGGIQEILPLVYDELRALAAHCMKRERPNHTLQPTAIVHEACIRLMDQNAVDWKSRAHFLAIAAQMIRRVLVDHGRRRNALKRGGPSRTLIENTIAPRENPNADVLTVHEALSRLAQLHPRQAQVTEMRFFGGLTNEEIAHVLGVSRTTVADDWAVAKAWLSRALKETDEP